MPRPQASSTAIGGADERAESRKETKSPMLCSRGASLLCATGARGHGHGGVTMGEGCNNSGARSKSRNALSKDHGVPSLMSLGQELAPHLPFLRRYARALTGSQAHGDAFVRATLEAIVAEPDEFPARRRSPARPLPHLPRDLVDRQHRGRRGAVARLRRQRGHRPCAPVADHAPVAPGAAADQPRRLFDRGHRLI